MFKQFAAQAQAAAAQALANAREQAAATASQIANNLDASVRFIFY